MGRPRKYTKARLEKAIRQYFLKITREEVVTVPEDTGELDKYGHKIYREVPAVNQLGEELKETRYLVPPTIGGLCLYLGISSSTWAEYADESKHPEFSAAAAYARGRIKAYLQQELLTRNGRDVKGIIFDLQNNHGYREKVELDTREQELKIAKLEAELEQLQGGSRGKEIRVELEGAMQDYAE